jgi:hypothetical protein
MTARVARNMRRRSEVTKRFTTRTWHPEPVPSQPVTQVQDPAVREILLTRRRALLAEIAAIERHCGIAPDAPDDEAA